MKNRFILTPYFLDEPVPELEALAGPDWCLNKTELPAGDKQTRMSVLHKGIADFVADAILKGNRPVSVAGDCCAAIGVSAGFQRTDLEPVLIWFDAHGDFNTWDTTPSGFLGGMPLAMMVGIGDQTMVKAVQLEPLPQEDVILTDARDLDPGERILVETSKISFLARPDDLINFDLPDRPIYIHFDTDMVNPKEAPAMNYPANGGATAEIMETIFKHLAQTGRVAAVSVSTWNPKLDNDGQSRSVCMRLLETLINA